MLALTQDAAEVIRTIIDSAEEELPPDSGLRIAAQSTDSTEAQLEITVVGGPGPGDETVQEHGATVYLSSDASMLLDDKVLDAHAHEDTVHFTIAEQGAPPAAHDH